MKVINHINGDSRDNALENLEIVSLDVKRARNALDNLTDSERAELFAEYCLYCGSKDPRCQCSNDE